MLPATFDPLFPTPLLSCTWGVIGVSSLQVYKPGVGLGFHFDKDEHLLKATGEMQHPIWSSILYLTGGSSSSSSGGGGGGGGGGGDSCGSKAGSSGCAGSIEQKGCKQVQQQREQQQQQQQQQQPDLASLKDWDGVRQGGCECDRHANASSSLVPVAASTHL
jgi:hypothetical protein